MDSGLEFAQKGAAFTTELFRLIAQSDLKKNTVYSPLAIQICMALLFAGAKGETASQIANVMKFVSHSPLEVASSFRVILDKYFNSDFLKIANKVYVQEGRKMKVDYQMSVQNDYYAEADMVNFADSVHTVKTINAWVSSKTAQRIPSLISSDDFNENTRLVLLNALDFKGSWEKPFNSKETVDMDFWLSTAKSIKMPFMHKSDEFGICRLQDLDCIALEMPYKNTDLSMVIFLPNKRDGLQNFVKNFRFDSLVGMAKNIAITKVDVVIPKFKVEYKMELSNVLKQLGLTKIFEQTADFSNMLDSTEKIFVSKAFHKTCIEVNEAGTVASAATGVVVSTRSMPAQFIANHPFMYIIWDKMNILFTGVFVNAATV